MKRLAVWLGILFAVFFFGMNGLAFAGQSPSISLYVNNTTGVASGVASDPDRPGQSITIHFYINAPWPNGTNIGQTYTNSYGQYSWQLPSSYQNGVTYALYAYAIDSTDGHGITSTSFTWEMPRYSPTISVYVNSSTGVASGIATDQDRPGQSLTIHFYIDGNYSSGTYIGGTYTSGSGQYSFQISSAYRDGQNHYLYAYAIDNTDGHGVAYTSFSWQPPNLYPPQGDVNTFQPGHTTITGWAQDQDYPSAALQVGMRIDGVWQAGSTANPGFSFSIPSEYLTGGPYSVEVTVKDAVESTWYVLGTTIIDHNLHDPEGVFHPYQPGDTTVTGWAQDQDDLSVTLRVNMQVDGVWKAGMWANGTENSGHGFSFDISPYLDNDSHTLRINVRDAFETRWYVLGTIPITSPPTIVSLSVDSTVSTCVASGRAYDPDRPLFPLALEFYIDGNRSSGTFLGSTDTDESTELFSFDIPYTYQNGVSHTLFVYAIDSLDGDSETSTSFTWVGDSPTIELSIDPETCVVSGTAYDPNLPEEPITIHFYLDDPWPAQTKIGDTSTDSSTTQFSWEIPLSYQDGEEHILHVYAIDHINGHGVAWTSFDCGEDGQCTTISLSLDDSTGVVSGTASDPDRPETSITIDFYIDGDHIQQILTNTSGQISWTIPNQETYRDGEPHTLVAIAIDDDDCDGEATISFTWEEGPPDSNIVGEVYPFQPRDTTITGWAQDQDDPDATLPVRLLIDDDEVEEVYADGCGQDWHEFSFDISAYINDGNSHSVVVEVRDAIEDIWEVLGTTTIIPPSAYPAKDILVGVYYYPGGWHSDSQIYHNDSQMAGDDYNIYKGWWNFVHAPPLDVPGAPPLSFDQDYWDLKSDKYSGHKFRRIDWEQKYLFDADQDTPPADYNFWTNVWKGNRFQRNYGHLFGWSEDMLFVEPLLDGDDSLGEADYLDYLGEYTICNPENPDDPEVIETWTKQIDAAADHGVDFFAYEMFWNYHDVNRNDFQGIYEDNIEKKYPPKPLDSGFLAAPNRDRMRFAFFWINHDWEIGQQNYSQDALEMLVDFLHAKYFQKPNYLKINGKPVIYIYNIDKMDGGFMRVGDFNKDGKIQNVDIDGNGVIENLDTDGDGVLDYSEIEKEMRSNGEVNELLGHMRCEAKKLGYKDLYIVGMGDPCNDTTKPKYNNNYRGSGFDAITNYNHRDRAEDKDYAAYTTNVQDRWINYAEALIKPSFQPAVSASIYKGLWTHGSYLNTGMKFLNERDEMSGAETPPQIIADTGTNPFNFKIVLENARDFVNNRSDTDGIIMINAWNEWGEGGVIEPTQQHGWGYLEAIRDVVTGDDPVYELSVSWPIGDIWASDNCITADEDYPEISWNTSNFIPVIFYRINDGSEEQWLEESGTSFQVQPGSVYTFNLYKYRNSSEDFRLLDSTTVVARPATPDGYEIHTFEDDDTRAFESSNLYGLGESDDPEKSDGLLKFYTKGGEEYDAGAHITISGLSIPAQTCKKIKIRMKVIHGYNKGGRVWWKNNMDSTWHAKNFSLDDALTSYDVESPYYNDGRWYEYEIDLSGDNDWRETIEQVRLEPVIQDDDADHDGGALIEIDYIVATP